MPLRFFLGLTFLYAGLDKIADPGFLDPGPGGAYLGNQLQGFARSPIGFLIQSVVMPQVQLAGLGVIATELLVGGLVLVGVLTRPVAAVGALLNMTLFLSLTWSIQPYFLAPDSIYAVAWITMALVGDSGILSLQSYVQARNAHNKRSAAIIRTSHDMGRRWMVLFGIGSAAVGLLWLLAMLPKSG